MKGEEKEIYPHAQMGNTKDTRKKLAPKLE